MKKWCNLNNVFIIMLSILMMGGSSVSRPAVGSFADSGLTVAEASSERAYVVPGGNVVGIRVKTGGAMVVEVERKWSQIRVGDVITSVNGTEVRSAGEFAKEMQSSSNEKTQISLQRNGKEIQAEIPPYEGRVGIEVRDGQSGVGTLTYYNPETGRFGALGHGVADNDAGILVPMGSGLIAQCTVTGLRRGESGAPGELRGAFSESVGEIGQIDKNEQTGIFGNMERRIVDRDAVPVALASEVKEGPAVILSTVQGNNTEEYEIEIQKVNERARDNRQLEIQVTDSQLIEKTGGIIQGMSGSPILQDGMFVGAVTHVFLNEPTKGYGILAETMIE